VALFWSAGAVRAQQPIACSTDAGGRSTVEQFLTLFGATGNDQIEFLEDRIRLTGLVDLPVPCQQGTRISADVVEIFHKGSLLTAAGNVVFADPEGHITAERVEFNLREGTGKFYQAAGIVSMGPGANRAEFGNQDPDVYFWGELIEKLDVEKYRISDGGFTTCVQPEPRWAVGSDRVVIDRNDYAMARNMVLRVKGVPLLYLPVIYYPMGDDERATGFLMPTYGTSRLRGGSLSNAFFLAINRSQDATFFHDWFTRAGQGVGAEYRYVANASSTGQFRAYRFSQRETEFSEDDRIGTLPANTSYDMRAAVVHSLGPAVRARGRVEYSTDILAQQLFNQTMYYATNPARTIEAGVSGAWGAISTNAEYQRIELFSSATASNVYGSTPRLNLSVSPTRLFGAPIYASVNTEYSTLPNRTVVNGVVSSNNDLTRIDLAPTLRIPLSRLTYLSANTSASYRWTRYDRSTGPSGSLVPVPLARTYLALRSDIVGPVFNKIWDTPESRRTERMKHVVEPRFSVDYTSEIANARNLPLLRDLTDVIVGNSARITYGLTNRFMSRGRATDATRPNSREFLTIGVQQTYYTNEEASRWDTQYSGAVNRTTFVDLSPIAVTTSFTPVDAVTANSRVEYDVSGLGFQTVSLGGSLSSAANTANLSYSRVLYSPTYSTQFLTATNTIRLAQGRANASYSLNWDLQRSYVVSQAITTSYLAQCCGIQFEYQQFNFPDLVDFPVTSDRRFNFGVVLAGLGTFSNFFGAFGGGQP
jgi:lipopolysaccharide assembly outer membrane protein LptD (OstA)